MAVRSASPIHYLQMNAAGQKFWLGGQTSSYCPGEVVQNCPPGNATVLAPGGNSLVRDTAYIKPHPSVLNIYKIHPSYHSKRYLNTNNSSIGRRSPRRPTSLRRPHRRPELHPGPLRLHPPRLGGRQPGLRARYPLGTLYLQRLGCKWSHGLSHRGQALAGVCRHGQCDRALW
jgi:hypothetical protein